MVTMKVKLLLLMLLFPVLLLMPLLCVAEDKELEQYVAEQHQILFDYVQNNSKFDPDFYIGLEQSIQGLIISTEISKRVMGKAHYVNCSPEQFADFDSAFKNTLLNTYSSTLFTVDNIDIINHYHPKNRTDLAVLNMQIDNTKLIYKMKQFDGEWRVIGMIFEGIDILKVFRQQFNRLVYVHKGDYDAVIDEWTANLN